jgi:hypothetical protein
MVKIIVGARSSVVERIPDKNEAEGPIPSAPTIYFKIFLIYHLSAITGKW